MEGEAAPRPPKVRVGYAGTEVTKPPNWHGLVTADLLFNNLTTGLFLAAAAGELARPELLGMVARLAYPLALLFLVFDLSFLVLDLGNPSRFHHMLRVFKITSPMSLGTWSLAVYSLPLTAIVVIDLVGWLGGPPASSSSSSSTSLSSSGIGAIRMTIIALGFVPALTSASYKGVLFSTSSQPGWRDARWLGAYFANSAVTYGTAGLYTLALASGHRSAAAAIRMPLVMLVVSNLIFLSLLAAELRPALVRSHTRRELWWLALLAAGIGVLVPSALLISSGAPIAGFAAVVCLLIGAAAWRHAIVMLPHRSQSQDGH